MNYCELLLKLLLGKLAVLLDFLQFLQNLVLVFRLDSKLKNLGLQFLDSFSQLLVECLTFYVFLEVFSGLVPQLINLVQRIFIFLVGLFVKTPKFQKTLLIL